MSDGDIQQSSTDEKLNVCVRVRPLMNFERQQGAQFAWNMEDNYISLDMDAIEKAAGTDPNMPPVTGNSEFMFHRVFTPEESTKQVYEEVVERVVSSGIEGFNGTVFAYGQTASGKTHTITGSPQDFGILPLALKQIFKSTQSCQKREYLLRVSYMEIYNEKIRDLLTVEQVKSFPIIEDPIRGVMVTNLTERAVFSFEQVSALISQAEENRHYGRTHMNEWSSRSHCIFRIIIESKAVHGTDDEKVLFSTLNFVDLAGSERISKEHDLSATRHEEGRSINKSLLFLGTVIRKLAKQDKTHIPFRDSKLTRILQSSLGGNARTTIICTVSPATSNLTTSISTLKFGQVSSTVQNTCTVNEIDQDDAYLYRHEDQIEELKMELEELEDVEHNEGFYGDAGDVEALKQTLRLKIQHLTNLIVVTGKEKDEKNCSNNQRRRKTVGSVRGQIEEMVSLSKEQEYLLVQEQLRVQNAQLGEKIERLEADNFNVKNHLKQERKRSSVLEEMLGNLEAEKESVDVCLDELENENTILRERIDLYEKGIGLSDLSMEELTVLDGILSNLWRRTVVRMGILEREEDDLMNRMEMKEDQNVVYQINDEEMEDVDFDSLDSLKSIDGNQSQEEIAKSGQNYSVPQTPENVKQKLDRLNLQNNNKLCLKSLFQSLVE